MKKRVGPYFWYGSASITKSISSDDLKRIEDAVKKAESKTSAEIVPMIVGRSSAVGHVPLLLFTGQLLVLLMLLPFVSAWLSMVPSWWMEIGVFALAGVLTWIQKDWPFWQRRLVAIHDQIASVERRAQLEFYLSNIKTTEHKTGVLVFVSLLERRAVILADQAVAEHFPNETWQEAVSGLIARVKSHNLAEGFSYAIESVGARLADKFPRTVTDVNELPDAPVIKD
jgi:putative membrane protein